jgi:hypothetical protein
LSSLAQVYLFPGSPIYDAERGRSLYMQAIGSYPDQADYFILSTKLNLILSWAANEYGFKNAAASSRLLALAQNIVRGCNLPEAAKPQLQSMVDGVRSQLKLQSAGPSLFTSRLVGRCSRRRTRFSVE